MDDRLYSVLERARRSTFYAEYLKEVGTWESVPLTTKEHLRQAYPFGLLAVEKTDVVSYHESSGTAGKATASFFSRADWADITERFLRNAAALSKEDTFFIKTPYSMVTTAHQAHRAAERVGALIIPGDNRSSNMPYSRVAQVLRDLSASLSWSLPTEGFLWSLAARAHGLDPREDFPALRGFWVAGEILSRARRQALSECWGDKKVFEDYGSTETGSLAGELACGELHLWSDRLLAELWLEDGGFARRGRGRLVVTPYFSEAMPLVRYLVDDEVEIFDCPCGSDFPALRVWGRAGEVACIAGRELFPKEIEEAVYAAGRSAGLLLWKGKYDDSGLEIEFHGTSPQVDELDIDLDIPVRSCRVPLSHFVDPKVLTAPLQFSKPKFLFSKEAR